MDRMQRTTIAGLAIVACVAIVAAAETKKEFRFSVNGRANVSVDTPYGTVTVKPGVANQVLVTAILASDRVELDNGQKGNRIELESHLLKGGDEQSGRVDYELTVPPDTTVSLRSTAGPSLSVEQLRGDLRLEGATAKVDVRNCSYGHVHIRTMNGPITLTQVKNAHVEVTSISGDIHLNSVDGQLVQVGTTSGRIFYDGDFGLAGDYTFTTHSGDIEALIPGGTSADFNAHSVQGHVQSDISLSPKEHPMFPAELGRSFFGTMGKAASEVVFKSFSGRIRLKHADKTN